MAEYWYVRISDDAAFNYAIDNDCFLMQYQYEKQERKVVTSNRNCCNQIKSGDWLMLGKDDCIYAVGRACKPKHIPGDKTGFVNDESTAVFYENIDASNGFKGEWGQRIDVEKWQFCLNDGISNGGVKGAAIGGIVQNTVFKIEKDFFDNKKCELRRKFMQTLGMSEESRLLLIANYNLILTGAPGTGKTYLAKQIAQRLVFGEGWSPKDENEFSEEEKLNFTQQVGFCQFHTSYDYTDFVEGLRPEGNNNVSIGFALLDGSFKKFCRDAKKSCKYDGGKKYDEANSKKFVFIIDEINRGDISKISGELFFAIDPGYRGVKGLVKTQYTNMIQAGDEFKEGFYVPENVYIIGTMNDIDRSVESMDFAMRRRFAWMEIKAEESKCIIDAVKEVARDFIVEAKRRMDRLNLEIIKEEYQLGTAYQIGGAYFKKIEMYSGEALPGAFELLWKHHLYNVLHEYLRGTPNVKEHLAKLKSAYDEPAPRNIPPAPAASQQ
jgi:MoxR-like ATPase